MLSDTCSKQPPIAEQYNTSIAPEPYFEQWDQLPEELRNRRQWCIASSHKRPLMTDGNSASSTKPSTWTDFNTACSAAKKLGWHIGYVLAADDPFSCIDLDIKPDTSSEFIRFCEDTITGFDSFTEKSKSGRGYHIWVKGNIGKGAKTGGTEVYSQERFIICTGNIVANKPIAQRNELVNKFADSIRGEVTSTSALPDSPEIENDKAVLERAFSASNANKLKAHFDGKWEVIGHKDHSTADMSLLQMLAYYTPNNTQLTRLFLLSELGRRDKAKRKDYLPRSIMKVRQLQSSKSALDKYHLEYGKKVASVLLENYRQKQAEKHVDSKNQPLSRIKVYSAADLSSRPPVRWRVKGILPEEGFAAVYGPPASGKSFLTLDMLAHIAAGKHWFGHRVQQTSVAYVAFEGAHGVPQRVKAFQHEHWQLHNITFIEAPTINLIELSDRKALIDTLKKHLLTDGVLCLDTLAASAAGIDENSSEGMGKLISELQTIQYEIGGCILVVHHTGKDRERGLRGWSGLNGALDASIEISRSPNGNHSWKLSKAKDGQDGIGSPFTLKTIVISHDEYGEPITSCAVIPTETHTNIDQNEIAAADEEFVWLWVKKEVEASNFPSGRSLEGQRNQMRTTRKLTQKQLRDTISRLVSENRLQTEKNKGNTWYRAVDI